MRRENNFTLNLHAKASNIEGDITTNETLQLSYLIFVIKLKHLISCSVRQESGCFISCQHVTNKLLSISDIEINKATTKILESTYNLDTFNKHHKWFKEITASLIWVKKLKILEYTFRAFGDNIILTGQSTL